MGRETPNATSYISACHHMQGALSWAWHAHTHYAPSCRVKLHLSVISKVACKRKIAKELYCKPGGEFFPFIRQLKPKKLILVCFRRASIKQTSIICLIWAIMFNRGLLRLTHNTPTHFMLKANIPLWWFDLKYFPDTDLLNQQLKSNRRWTLMIIVMSSNASQPWWQAAAFALSPL